ncbi:hypothetical protein DEA8626_03275 [Defluviimonas aquaemixtae]|uniref:Ycf48-like protein n=1 Tax=Albidovulum aquaemixtae TaxID=1542388 RepID=A0A2R8BLH8_9RHOB|nr:hypothetical protein [Defluviimonas aquaemixtae]SPH24225.1 hypothetical protein DEA8626_03275 [Defluviimonas aquaemixtae]
MDKLWVGTRKGLFRFSTNGKGWRQGGPPAFLAEPVTFVLEDPRDGAVYAALKLGHFGCKLHRSDDGGESWTELPCPAYPASGAPDAPALDMIWALAPGGADQPGRLWAGTLPGGLFRSDNRGESWALVETLWNVPQREKWFGGGYDHPGIHSILVDPRDSDRLTLGVSCGGVWISPDGGETWEQGGQGLRADFLPPDQSMDPTSQDPHLIAACASDPDRIWCQHHCGIFSSKDGGRTFAEHTEAATPSAFGFAVAVHPHRPDHAWFVPGVKDECRVPVDGKLVVTRTKDGGETFGILSGGLPQDSAYDLVYRHALVVDDTGERLAMGSTTGNLWTSNDGGVSWSLVSANLPPIAQVAFA